MDEMSLCLLSPFSILMIPKAFKKIEIYLFQIKLSTMSTSFHKYCPEMHMKKYNIHKTVFYKTYHFNKIQLLHLANNSNMVHGADGAP